MHPRTAATLERLNQTKLFGRVGDPDPERISDQHAISVADWNGAMNSCQSEEWEELTHEATNSISSQLIRKDKDAYRRWNDIADDTREGLNSLIDTQVRPLAAALHLPDVFIHCVQWDLGHLLIESEYYDYVENGFFTWLSYYYAEGHFPCGWQGTHPEGKLLIY